MLPPNPSDPDLRRLPCAEGPLYYTDEGAGPALVALHGAPGSLRDWRWMGTILEDNLRFIRLDQPGFGETPLSTFPSAFFEARADWIVEKLSEMGVDRFAVVGHSIGGPLAMMLAARHPERVSALALLASVGLRPHRPFRRYPRMRRVSPLLRIPILKSALTLLIRKGFDRAGFPHGLSGETIRHIMHMVHKVDFPSNREALGKVRAPTLVAWTRDDHLIDTEISEELAAACPEGPRLSFDEGGHNLQKSHALEIAEKLAEWVSEMAG